MYYIKIKNFIPIFNGYKPLLTLNFVLKNSHFSVIPKKKLVFIGYPWITIGSVGV